MKFSLVMATLGRSKELILFLDSLKIQTYKDFHLIIVDQNTDNRVFDIYSEYKNSIDITYIHNDRKGLSLNRNIGMRYVSGDIVAFPDDDCIYEADTLEKIGFFFKEHPNYDFYTCNTKDININGTIFKAKVSDADITIYNFMSAGISFTIFVRVQVIGSFKFDEQMGVGTQFGSGEESDLLLFLLKNKNRGRYHAGWYIYHPVKPETPEKTFIYGKGFGAVYKKAIIEYNFFILFFIFTLRMVKGLLNIIIHREKKSRLASFYGRLIGFIQYWNN